VSVAFDRPPTVFAAAPAKFLVQRPSVTLPFERGGRRAEEAFAPGPLRRQAL